jgi:hypothetical protein
VPHRRNAHTQEMSGTLPNITGRFHRVNSFLTKLEWRIPPKVLLHGDGGKATGKDSCARSKCYLGGNGSNHESDDTGRVFEGVAAALPKRRLGTQTKAVGLSSQVGNPIPYRRGQHRHQSPPAGIVRRLPDRSLAPLTLFSVCITLFVGASRGSCIGTRVAEPATVMMQKCSGRLSSC